jgi:hypothetical protein
LFSDSTGDEEKRNEAEDLTSIKSQKVSAAGTSEAK